MSEFKITLLRPQDCSAWSRMLTQNSVQYMEYFRPFDFDEGTLRNILSDAKADRYWGIWWGSDLAGFFMLRGFDAGFRIPAYGVCISENFANRGLLKVSLECALAWCRLAGIERMMLKVHPDNKVARATYEKFGFSASGTDPKNGHLIYHRTV